MGSSDVGDDEGDDYARGARKEDAMQAILAPTSRHSRRRRRSRSGVCDLMAEASMVVTESRLSLARDHVA